MICGLRLVGLASSIEVCHYWASRDYNCCFLKKDAQQHEKFGFKRTNTVRRVIILSQINPYPDRCQRPVFPPSSLFVLSVLVCLGNFCLKRARSKLAEC